MRPLAPGAVVGGLAQAAAKRRLLLVLLAVVGLTLFMVVAQTSAPLTVVFDTDSTLYDAKLGRVFMRALSNKPASAECFLVDTSESVKCPPGSRVSLAPVPCSGPFLVRVDATAGDETASAWAVVQCSVVSSTTEAQTATRVFTKSSPLEAAPTLNAAAQTQAVATQTAGAATHVWGLTQAVIAPTATLKPDQLPAPSGLRVSASGVASWNSVSDAGKYQLEHQILPSSQIELVDAEGGAASFDLSSRTFCCVLGTTYRVRIRAIDTANSDNNSPPSSWVTFTFNSADKPTPTLKPSQVPPPSGIRVAANGLVRWNRVARADKYEIAIHAGSSSVVNYIEDTKSVSSYHLPDSEACCRSGTIYRVWLRAVDTDNLANNSPWSSAVTFTHNPAERSGRAPSSTPDGSYVLIPTQDHSRLPAGAEVKSETPWIQFYEIALWRIGDESIVAAGARAAIDIWGPLGVDAEVCFGDIGSLLFLDAAYSPRKQFPLLSYLRDGMTCGHLYTAGTLVLMPGSPDYALTPTTSQDFTPTPSATPESMLTPSAGELPRKLAQCMVTTNEYLHFRETPEGELISLRDGLKNQLPAKVTLTALERTTDWFKVDWYGVQGWISAHYVTPRGDCE